MRVKRPSGEDAMGEDDGKVKGMISSAKRRVGMEAPRVTEDDESKRAGVVRGALQAFGSGDMDGFCDALTDDVMWENPEGENFPGGGDLSGPNEVRERFIGDIGRTYTSFGFRPETWIETDHEDAVFVIGRFEGEGVTGDAVDTPGVMVWGFTGSEVTHVRVFTDSAAFPEVVTEEKEKEWEEEEKKKEEEEKKDDSDSDDSEAKGDDDSKSESDDDSKSESDDDTKSESDDDTKSESDDDTKSESNGSSPEAKSDDDSDDDDSDDKDREKAESKSGSSSSDDD
jgi:ketosteroid isomerase-like protein